MASMIVTDHHADLGGEKCRRPLVPYAWPMADSVKSQDTDEILPDWNQSGLAEFGFSNREGSISEVRILVLQADCLTQS
jgi:hypothetical protein